MSDPAATLADVERVRERTRLDLHSSWYPMVVVGAAALGAAGIAGLALLLASSIADALGGPRASLAAQCAVIGVLYLLFGRFQPSRVLGGIGVGVIALGAGLAVADPGHDAALANLCLGAALVLGGLHELSREDAT